MSQKAPHVMIATPCYGSSIFQSYYISNIRLMNEVYKRRTMDISYTIRGGDSLITRLRNSITAEFLANEKYTHLLWIDADIGFEPDEVFKLVEANLDVACGCYPLKALPIPEVITTTAIENGVGTIIKDDLFSKYTKYPFNPVGTKFDVVNGFVEVKDAPTGMMCIKREVFMKMIEAYPELKYDPDKQIGLENLESKINDLYYNFFDTILSDEQFVDPATGQLVTKKRYLSEDYAFCRLWQKIGGKIHIYANSQLTHTGLFTYQGNMEKYFKHNYKIEPRQAPEAAPVAPPLNLNMGGSLGNIPVLDASAGGLVFPKFQTEADAAPETEADTKTKKSKK